ELARNLRPEAFGIVDAALIQRLIFREALDVRLRREIRGRRKHTVLPQQRLHVCSHRSCHAHPPFVDEFKLDGALDARKTRIESAEKRYAMPLMIGKRAFM